MIRYMLVRLKPIWVDAHVITPDDIYSPWAATYPTEGMICSLSAYQQSKHAPAVHFVCADTIRLSCPAKLPAWDLLRALHV
jgi:hypothetical protein